MEQYCIIIIIIVFSVVTGNLFCYFLQLKYRGSDVLYLSYIERKVPVGSVPT
jgi:hypothetical protein